MISIILMIMYFCQLIDDYVLFVKVGDPYNCISKVYELGFLILFLF